MIIDKNGLRIGIISYCDLNDCDRHWKDTGGGAPQFKLKNAVSELRDLRIKVNESFMFNKEHTGNILHLDTRTYKQTEYTT